MLVDEIGTNDFVITALDTINYNLNFSFIGEHAMHEFPPREITTGYTEIVYFIYFLIGERSFTTRLNHKSALNQREEKQQVEQSRYVKIRTK